MAGFETIIYEKKDSIGYITLNRERVLNAYNVKMRDELFEVLNAVKEDEEVSILILRGKGEKAFCAGADLTEFLTAPSTLSARQIRFRRDIWRIFNELKIPLIACLHGFVLGSGLEMALFCDIRICSPDTVFGMPEASLGIIPGAGGTQTLPRTIGISRAIEILLTGRWIDAQEALKIGLVNKIVEKENLISACEEMARKILSFEKEVVISLKELVKKGSEMKLQEGLFLEAITFERLIKSRRRL